MMGPAMAKAVADLIATGATGLALDAYDQGRFTASRGVGDPACLPANGKHHL